MTDLLAGLPGPLQHAFLVEAILVGSFLGVVCATLSCFVVLKGWSLVGDAVSHAVLPGVILAYLAGLPMALGAVASGVACVAASGAIGAHTRVKPDAVLGILFTGFLAVGLILLAANPGDVHFTHILFGNLLGIETADLVQVLLVGSATLLVVLAMRRDLILVCFDPAQARVLGLNPARLELVLLVLLAMTVVAALQAVGVVLAIALLITPGCTGRLLADRFGAMMAWAWASAVLSCVAGTVLSFYLDGATGPCIVLVQAGLFVLALAARRGGA